MLCLNSISFTEIKVIDSSIRFYFHLIAFIVENTILQLLTIIILKERD